MVEFKGDGEEPLVKALQLAADALISELTAEHFQEMTYCREGAADTGKIRAGEEGIVGQWEFGNGVAMGSGFGEQAETRVAGPAE